MSRFLNRLFRAARLDPNLYEEVAADPKAMLPAMMAVFIYSAASAYGNFGRAGAAGINFGMITTISGWYIWAFSSYFIGTRLVPETQISIDRKAVLRALGFASSPGLIRLLGLIPDMAGAAFLIASVWMIAAAVVAIRQVLNYKSIHRAAVVCIAAWIISHIFQGLFLMALLSVFGVSATTF